MVKPKRKPLSKQARRKELTGINLKSIKDKLWELEARLNGLAEVQSTLIDEIEFLGGFSKKGKK